jgi:hypothetical protein
MKHLRVLQPEPFSEIEISLAPPRIEATENAHVVPPSGGLSEVSAPLPAKAGTTYTEGSATGPKSDATPATPEEEKPL